MKQRGKIAGVLLFIDDKCIQAENYLVSSVECTGPWISIEIKFGRSSGSIVGLQCISILKRHALILIWVFMKWVKFKDGLVNQVS